MRNPIATFVLGLILGLVVAGGTFFAGMNQGQAQAQDQRTAFLQSRGIDPAAAGAAGSGAGGGAAGAGGGGGGAGFGRGGGTNGRITNIAGSTVTISSTREGLLTVNLPASPTILKQAQGSISDLKVGDRIAVQGTRSGTNIAATTVQIVPNFAPPAGGVAPPPTP